MFIFPKPIKQDFQDGIFILSFEQTISFSHEFASEVAVFQSHWLNIMKKPILSDIMSSINFVRDISLSEEQYQIKVMQKQLSVFAKTKRGMAYAIHTLLCIIQNDKGKFVIPCQEIDDFPQYFYRGFMLDVARHFFDKKTIIKILDVMAFHKLNFFHWHFSDDQGWRIESKVFPRLHEVASKRNIPTKTKLVYDHEPISGYYTQEDIKEIVQYARKKHIEIVPELDIPGHATAIMAAYPNLSHHESMEVKTNFGIANAVLCLGNLDLMPFLKMLLQELIDLFQPRYFHLGSDEVKLEECETCEKCQQEKQNRSFASFQKLQIATINELSFFLKAQNIQTIVWNDLADEDLNPDIIIQHWKPFTKKITKQAIKRNHNIIASPFFHYYLDYPNSMTTLKNVFSYQPNSKNNFDKKNTLGLESALWTEWINSENKLFFHLLPRLAAFANTAWRGVNQNYYDFFVDVLDLKMIYARNNWYYCSNNKQQSLVKRIINTGKWIKNKDYEYEKQKED